MDTIFPASKIEEMKEQGVNEHLIDLVSMNPDAYRILVSRNIENGTIFKHFYGEDPTDFRYAFIAGLISKADADFLNKLSKELEEDSGEGSEEDPEENQDPEGK